MNSSYLLLSLLFITLIYQSYSSESCKRKNTDDGYADCGTGCTGTPTCDHHTCGNKDNMCYCDCSGSSYKCRTSELGYTWNDGIKLANGSFALNGTKGDGKEYKC